MVRLLASDGHIDVAAHDSRALRCALGCDPEADSESDSEFEQRSSSESHGVAHLLACSYPEVRWALLPGSQLVTELMSQ